MHEAGIKRVHKSYVQNNPSLRSLGSHCKSEMMLCFPVCSEFVSGCVIQSVQQKLGYCPQFDALINQMTVTETLWMYARLRGVAEQCIAGVVDKLVQQLTLGKHAHKQAGDLRYSHRRGMSFSN